MPAVRVRIEPDAVADIQAGVHYYNSKQKGLGKRFLKEVKNSIAAIKLNPFFQIRYDNVRCLTVSKFPYMIHFIYEETDRTAIIYAVINTSLDPDKNWLNKK